MGVAVSAVVEPEKTLLRRARKMGRRFLNPVPTEIGGFSTMLKVLPLYFTNKAETVPRRKLGPSRRMFRCMRRRRRVGCG